MEKCNYNIDCENCQHDKFRNEGYNKKYKCGVCRKEQNGIMWGYPSKFQVDDRLIKEPAEKEHWKKIIKLYPLLNNFLD
jgi:hypothetical protein